VRFALAIKGTQPIYLDSLRLVVRPHGLRGRRLILNPARDRLVPLELAGGEPVNVLGSAARRRGAVELVPADSVGYRFELTRLANTLRDEGYSGNVRLALRVKYRLNREHVRPFDVNTDLWTYPKEDG
jgi:hypothetical protein